MNNFIDLTKTVKNSNPSQTLHNPKEKGFYSSCKKFYLFPNEISSKFLKFTYVKIFHKFTITKICIFQ
jgi:hypothetical protein